MEAARTSVTKISRLDFTALLPGHGVPLTHNARENVREFAQTFAVQGNGNADPVAV